jgi:hypothetical protein
MSQLTMSGTLSIPDADINSLSIQLCWDSVCATTAGADASAPQPFDAGADSGPSVRYALQCTGVNSQCNTYFTFTQVAPDSYQFVGWFYLDNAPSGTATHGTVTWTITSGGTSIYSATIPATYKTGMGCTEPYQECTLVLSPEWVSNPVDAN